MSNPHTDPTRLLASVPPPPSAPPTPIAIATHPVSDGRRTVGSLLASPAAVTVVIPLLVVGAGLLVGWLGTYQLRTSAQTMAEKRLADSWRHLAQAVDAEFGATDSMLDSIGEALLHHHGTRDPSVWYADMAPLLVGRPGLAHAGFAEPDGFMANVFTHPSHGPCVTLRISDQYGGWQRDFTVQSGNATMVDELRGTGYDPRKLDAWTTAIVNRNATWSTPYRLITGEVGVRRARAVRGPAGELIGVAFVIWSTERISDELRTVAPGFLDHCLIATTKGEVLAGTDVAAQNGKALAVPVDRVGDLGVPALGALFQAPESATPNLVQNQALEGTPYLVQRQGLKVNPDWHLLLAARLDPLLASAQRNIQETAIAMIVLLPLALIIAIAYARHVIRVAADNRIARRAANDARDQARVLGSYVLERRIGGGGMGEVWIARHRLLARPAALKVIKGDFTNPQAVERFHREARATASLTSPHTVTVFDFGTLENGSLYYAMELLNGADLAVLTNLRPYLPQEAVVAIMLQVCDSLEEAHAVGLVHRDIKPANLFLARQGSHKVSIKVLDFGLVSMRPDLQAGSELLTGSGFITGTPGFMAPEVLAGKPFDGRADLYSLGCTAFRLLTGCKLFTASNALEEMRMHLETPPPRLANLAKASVAPEFDALIADLVAKDPDLRPRNVGALRERLLNLHLVPDLTAAKQVLEELPQATTRSEVPEVQPLAHVRL